MDKILERRNCHEVRALSSEGRKIAGHAAVFNSRTMLAPGFFEEIAPGAFSNSIRDGRDVVMLFNHDPNFPLARTGNGTLRLREDSQGLFYEGDINPDDSQAMDIHAKILRGDVSQSSFGFEIRAERFETTEDGSELRIVEDAELWDVSPVTWPAYADTDATARMAFRNASPEASVVEAIDNADEKPVLDSVVSDPGAMRALQGRANTLRRQAEDFLGTGEKHETEIAG